MQQEKRKREMQAWQTQGRSHIRVAKALSALIAAQRKREEATNRRREQARSNITRQKQKVKATLKRARATQNSNK